MKYRIYILSLILLLSTSLLEARKLKFKNKKTKDNSTSIFGDKNFEKELKSFRNSSKKNDKSDLYYGWETNENINSEGDPNAIKGGMLTILGGSEYPNSLKYIMLCFCAKE